jgi:hypothetical protein
MRSHSQTNHSKPNAIALPNQPLKLKRDRTLKLTPQTKMRSHSQTNHLKHKRDRTPKLTAQNITRSHSQTNPLKTKCSKHNVIALSKQTQNYYLILGEQISRLNTFLPDFSQHFQTPAKSRFLYFLCTIAKSPKPPKYILVKALQNSSPNL